jgi:hypothetical protein
LHDDGRDQLLAQLSAHRVEFLRIAKRVDEAALALPTRNAEWSVRNVLAHVLASDADLIRVLRCATGAQRAPLTEQQHREEMARWEVAVPGAMLVALSDRARQWQRLLAALPLSLLDVRMQVWWKSGSLINVVGDYVAHDPEHGEDVRLALEELRG